MEHVPQIELTRQERLALWMSREGNSFAQIGREIGIQRNSIRRLLCGNTAPVKRVEQLRKAGIPEDLLPVPLDITPGPKPKK